MTEYRKRPVYAVATTGYTCGLDIITLHTEYEEALATWNAVRIGMIWKYEKKIQDAPSLYPDLSMKQLDNFLLRDHRKQIEFLSCENPDKIDCKCDNTPIIMELVLEDTTTPLQQLEKKYYARLEGAKGDEG